MFNNHNIMWIIGWVITDGYLRGNNIEFHLGIKDGEEIYNKFKNILHFKNKICRRTNSIYFCFHRKYLEPTITECNLLRGPKTDTVRLPTISKEYIPSLLRGIFEGDGYFTLDKYSRIPGHTYIRVGLCGNNLLLSDINNILVSIYNVKLQKIDKYKNANCYRMRWGKHDSRYIIDLLYRNSKNCSRLSRKYNLVNSKSLNM